jgi:maltose O-acetyltransferase
MTEQRVEPKDLPLWRRLVGALNTEFLGVHPRLHAYNLAAVLLPLRGSGKLRARLLRLAGFEIGRGTSVDGPIKISGPRSVLPRLTMGQECLINADCVFDLSEKVTLGDRVTLEPGVLIITSTHELDFPKHRAGASIIKPVVVGDGAWLRARCVILPGVTIGAGAVVEPGAVVNKDVAANVRVGGTPAIKLEVLEEKV